MVTYATIAGVGFLLATLAFTVHITKLSIERERHSPKTLRSSNPS